MRVLKVKAISLPYIFQVMYVLCFTRPRYQVSVYRTIGPLVFLFFKGVFFFLWGRGDTLFFTMKMGTLLQVDKS